MLNCFRSRASPANRRTPPASAVVGLSNPIGFSPAPLLSPCGFAPRLCCFANIACFHRHRCIPGPVIRHGESFCPLFLHRQTGNFVLSSTPQSFSVTMPVFSQPRKAPSSCAHSRRLFSGAFATLFTVFWYLDSAEHKDTHGLSARPPVWAIARISGVSECRSPLVPCNALPTVWLLSRGRSVHIQHARFTLCNPIGIVSCPHLCRRNPTQPPLVAPLRPPFQTKLRELWHSHEVARHGPSHSTCHNLGLPESRPGLRDRSGPQIGHLMSLCVPLFSTPSDLNTMDRHTFAPASRH